MILLNDEETDNTILESIPKDMDIYFPLHKKQVEALNRAQVRKVCDYIENLPTDGWDKWYYYHRDLANKIKEGAGL